MSWESRTMPTHHEDLQHQNKTETFNISSNYQNEEEINKDVVIIQQHRDQYQISEPNSYSNTKIYHKNPSPVQFRQQNQKQQQQKPLEPFKLLVGQIKKIESNDNQSLSVQEFAQLQQENKLQTLKLKRLTVQKTKLKEELSLDRIKASNASLMVINFTEDTEEPLLPQLWPDVITKNRYKRASIRADNKRNQESGCCIIM